MDFIQKSNTNTDVHREQEADSFIMEQDKRFLESVKAEQEKGINYLSGKAGKAIGNKISGEASKNSVRDITREASKEAMKKAAEESAKQAAKETTKQISQKAAKDSASFIVTTAATGSTATVTTVAGTAAGTATGFAVNPLIGTVIGFAAGSFIGNFVGDVAGNAIDKRIVRISTKQKMLEGLKDTTSFEGDGNGFVQNAGKAALMELGMFFRRLGTTLKWTTSPLTAILMFSSVFLLIVIPFLSIPLAMLCDSSSYAGGYIDDCVYYSQYEEPWASYEITEGETIKKSGCGPTTLAIVYSNLTGEIMTPDVAANWVVENGYYRNGVTWWSCFTSGVQKLGLTGENHGKNLYAALECIQDGGMVVISVGKSDGSGNALYRGTGHFMVIRGITEEGRILVADPASRKKTERQWDYSTIEEILKNCWSVTYVPSETME
ncbi:MAG: C39 family peptidase [Lachnospiraceae bacterium]|nr:C39 family peptidase [Lachnospiraceae bacterium]